MIKLIITVFTLAFASNYNAIAQQVTDTIKREPLQDIANKGMPAGMDIHIMASVATLHHYPLPDEVLIYSKQLNLSAAQLTKLNSIIKTLNLKKLEISQSVTLNEKTLSNMFTNRRFNEGAIIFYGNRYGLYEGEMRTAVLMACYQTGLLLNGGQIAKFEQLQKPND